MKYNVETLEVGIHGKKAMERIVYLMNTILSKYNIWKWN